MVLKFNTLDDLKKNNLKGKKVLLRVDFNVPLKQGKIIENSRITGVVPTIAELIKEKAKIIIISHFGRPKGKYDSSLSLSPVVDEVEKEVGSFLGSQAIVKFGVDCVGSAASKAIDSLEEGEILILENLRFHEGEESGSNDFSKQLALNMDYYVNDAFSCCHRFHSSITGVAKLLPSFAGRLLEKEIKCLTTAIENPQRPMAAIIGGSKVSTKIDVLNSIVKKADYLIIGGGMANTFLYARGYKIGKSLCEQDLKEKVMEITKNAEDNKCKIILPIDGACADSLENSKTSKILKVENIEEDLMILDAGAATVKKYIEVIDQCKTILWNGPLGAFEYQPYDNSSVTVAKYVAYLSKYHDLNSVAGGGDTVALLDLACVTDQFSYISTAGGAFLEWLEGKGLPGVNILIEQANKKAA